MDSGFIDYCERLWQEWISGDLKVLEPVASKFQIDYLPEPYLKFGAAENPLYVLATNPGNGMEHQRRANILSGDSIVDPSGSYREAANVLARFYQTKLKGQARTRVDGFMHLATRAGCDGVFQFESCPLHSKALPNKQKLPGIFEQEPFLRQYVEELRKTLRSKSVVALSAVGGMTSITTDSVRTSRWLTWQADLIGLAVDEASVLPLTTQGAKVTSALIYTHSQLGVKGLLLMAGSNNLPASEYRESIAEIIKASPCN